MTLKRILFVDDEPHVLDGLERMLRTQRHVWSVAFAASGPEALLAMEAEPFDVIVADMKMPGMNGAELLERVQTSYPGTVRIVLSGHADMAASIRSTSVCHQFLAKPCDATVLRELVAHACSLEALLREPSLRAAVGALAELPVRPGVYEALRVALAAKQADIKEVGRLVAQDAGIATKVLQLANSSFFGLRREVVDIAEAVSRVGARTLRELALSHELFRRIEGDANLLGISIEREQSHSLLAARIAGRLLEEKAAAQQAFLAAMLHDVGKLVLATCLPTHFQAVLVAGAGVERPFSSVERDVLGVTHAEIGAYLLGLWGIKRSVVEAVAHHHDPARAPGQEAFGVIGATHVAAALTREQYRGECITSELDERYLTTLGVAHKLPEWREMAAHEANAIAQSEPAIRSEAKPRPS